MPAQDEETPDQRLARNLSELLSELRVAQAGVQILFGFLLAVVFTAPFREASGFEKSVHLVAVLLAAASTALLTAPAAWHRILFRTGRRPQIVRAANRSALAGLICLAAAVTVTVALIVKVIFGGTAMVVLATVTGLMFITLWFGIPVILARQR